MAKTKCIKFVPCYFSNTYFGPPAIAGRVLWSRVCLSVLLSFCLSMDFLGIASSGFSRFLHGARNPYEVVCDRAKFSRNLGKWAKNGQQHGFLNLLKNFLINFYWICSTMNIHIICCVPAQIPYLEKFYFMRSGPNVLSQSDCWII